MPYCSTNKKHTQCDTSITSMAKLFCCPLPDGKAVHYAIRVRQSASTKKRILSQIRSEANCLTCQRRAGHLYHLFGPSGPLYATESDWYQYLRADTNWDVHDDVVVVKSDTFPSETDQRDTNFRHHTIVPSSVTDDETADRWAELKYLMGSITHRLEKLIQPGARESLTLIANELPKLERPDYWRPTVTYVKAIQDFAVGTAINPYEVTTKLKIFALMTGTTGRTVDGTINLSFQKVTNLIDFMRCETLSAARMMMAGRSETLKCVSNLTTASAKACKKIATVEDHWNKVVGEPESRVVTVLRLSVPSKPVPVPTKKTHDDTLANSAGQVLPNKTKAVKTHSTLLADYVHLQRPATATEFFVRYALEPQLIAGLSPLYVKDIQRMSPAYVVVEGGSNMLKPLKRTTNTVLYYRNVNTLPIVVTKKTKITRGTASLGRDWFKTRPYRDDRTAVVTGISLLASGHIFFALGGAVLPSNKQFPLSGGFHPAHLHSDYHDLRQRWAACATLVTPRMPSESTQPPNRVPMIGTILDPDAEITDLFVF